MSKKGKIFTYNGQLDYFQVINTVYVNILGNDTLKGSVCTQFNRVRTHILPVLQRHDFRFAVVVALANIISST